MINKKYSILFVFVIACFNLTAQPVKLKKVMKSAAKQTQVMLHAIAAASNDSTDAVSPRTLVDGKLKLVSSRDWTSGFFPGELWYLYEYTGKTSWKKEAIRFTSFMEREKTNGTTHDMGFKIYCSVGNAYRLTSDPHYRDVIIEAAKTLATRFHPRAGVLRSWDAHMSKWAYPVIIDNMMNLELLFAATQLSGDSLYYRIAVQHANTTLKNHFRADNSSYHVVDYDTATGGIIKKTTHQGYADGSAWARGQAWGLYGYTMCYRFTKDPRFLEQAEKIAAYLLHHPNRPADGVPYWDYNAPNIPLEERDASAAAVIASGLYELAGYSALATTYRKEADLIVRSLTDHYRSPVGENSGFLLLHSTGSRPSKSEVDVPLSYADYYYLEALLRSRN